MKIKDMNGKEIKIGDTVRKYGIIKDNSGDYKETKVKHLLPMHEGGEVMVWAGKGGAHHPLACEVINQE